MTHYEEFAVVHRRAIEFLNRQRDRRDGNFENDGDPVLILDPGHVGSPLDPNRMGELTEAGLTFLLAHEIVEECIPEIRGAVLFTRMGDPSLTNPAESLETRLEMITHFPRTPALSLHFNASDSRFPSPNGTSVFLPRNPSAEERAFAMGLMNEMRGLGIQAKEDYPELEAAGLEKLASGVFTRGLRILSGERAAPTALFEAVYYDDPEEQGRLLEKALDETGVWRRPRITEIASAICPSVRKAAAERESYTRKLWIVELRG